MAGDWIKMSKDLEQKPEVRRLSRILGVSRYDAIGRLHSIWSWADTHSLSGSGMDITEDDVDDIADLDGFAVALRQVGWLSGRAAALEFPNFDRHNGQSAKKRALEAERKRKSRTGSGQEADKCPLYKRTQSGLEKRREEYITTTYPNAQEITPCARSEPEVLNIMQSAIPCPLGDQLQLCAESFFAEMTAVGWKNKRGLPLDDWRPLARKYAQSWARNNATDMQSGLKKPKPQTDKGDIRIL